uniref:Ribosomal protein eL8/eL30/eS12/Gadd45 domain-containing protein n=1 Tax=Eutreptiella gymnastica TaxID=73025 RepID=A0A7S4FZA7_9EUGL
MYRYGDRHDAMLQTDRAPSATTTTQTPTRASIRRGCPTAPDTVMADAETETDACKLVHCHVQTAREEGAEGVLPADTNGYRAHVAVEPGATCRGLAAELESVWAPRRDADIQASLDARVCVAAGTQTDSAPSQPAVVVPPMEIITFGTHDLLPFIDRREHSRSQPLRHRPRLWEYCCTVLTDEVDTLAATILELLNRFQKRIVNDPKKFKLRKRYLVGLRQTVKTLAAKRCRMVLMAPNIEKICSEGGLDTLVNKVINLCHVQEVPIVFCLQRRKMGKIVGVVHGVSVVSILSADGANSEFKKLCEIAFQVKKEYDDVVEHKDQLFQAERDREVRERLAREHEKEERRRKHLEAQEKAKQEKQQRIAERRDAAEKKKEEAAERKAQIAAEKAAARAEMEAKRAAEQAQKKQLKLAKHQQLLLQQQIKKQQKQAKSSTVHEHPAHVPMHSAYPAWPYMYHAGAPPAGYHCYGFWVPHAYHSAQPLRPPPARSPAAPPAGVETR